jgi:hypothetical protein
MLANIRAKACLSLAWSKLRSKAGAGWSDSLCKIAKKSANKILDTIMTENNYRKCCPGGVGGDLRIKNDRVVTRSQRRDRPMLISCPGAAPPPRSHTRANTHTRTHTHTIFQAPNLNLPERQPSLLIKQKKHSRPHPGKAKGTFKVLQLEFE